MLRVLYFTLICALVGLTLPQHSVDACSSRAVPKPRPVTSSSSSSSLGGMPLETTTVSTTTTTTTTQRPNITFPTYKCPDTYDTWYCLNEATCFSIKIADNVMYNCECALGFMGQRCEFKELDGTYLPKRPLLEKASIASGATIALVFMFFICLTLYLRYEQRSKMFDLAEEYDVVYDDEVAVCLTKCRYCNERRCCADDANVGKKYRRSVGGGLNWRQHIETFSNSFVFKRSALKM